MDTLAICVLAIGVTIVAGTLLSARRRSRRDQDALAHRESVTQPEESATDGHAGIVIKCVSCGMHQVDGGPWQRPEIIAVSTEQHEVLGGVCPECRVPSAS